MKKKKSPKTRYVYRGLYRVCAVCHEAECHIMHYNTSVPSGRRCHSFEPMIEGKEYGPRPEEFKVELFTS